MICVWMVVRLHVRDHSYVCHYGWKGEEGAPLTHKVLPCTHKLTSTRIALKQVDVRVWLVAVMQ